MISIHKKIIRDAYLICDDNYILNFGFYKDFKKLYSNLKIREDYGDKIIMPAFVNAHTHLIFSYLRGKKLSSFSFSQWIVELLESLKRVSEKETLVSIAESIQELQDSGVLTIGDISINDQILKFFFQEKNCLIGGRIFLEYICIRDEDRFEKWQAIKKIYDQFSESRKISLGLSPHSLYTITKKGFEFLRSKNEILNLPIVMHFGESLEEKEFFSLKKGALFELITKINPHFLEDTISNPLSYLKTLNILNNKSLLIHYNDLALKDIPLLKRMNISIVHCPRSYQFFNHPIRFKINELLDAGINIALGTDSLASNSSLNFLQELQVFKKRFKYLKNSEIIKMATLNGGKALSLEDRGVIRKNHSYALMILDNLLTNPQKDEDIYEYIIFYPKKITHFFLSQLLK